MFSVLHLVIITCLSLAIILAVAYATVLNEKFWVKNISTHTLAPPPSTSATAPLTQDTNVMPTVLRALPQEALQAEAQAFTRATFSWLRGESERLDYRPNLEAFKPQIVASLQQKYLTEFQTHPIACPATGVLSDPETGVTIPCSTTQDPAALAELYARTLATSAVTESASTTPHSPSRIGF